MFYRGGNVNFPLYLYPSTESPDMFHQERKPNLADWLLPTLSAAYGFTPTPEEVLAYIYAVLYSPTYRQKYAQELRTDFPRIPFTADGDLFRQMAALGWQLICLHLLRNPANTAGVKYQGQGSDVVEEVRYDAATGRVYINADKYFEGVTPEMWEYRIGGYQVLKKYLEDRKGRRLDDPVRYIHIASAIAETICLQQQIDALYPQVEAQTIWTVFADGLFFTIRGRIGASMFVDNPFCPSSSAFARLGPRRRCSSALCAPVWAQPKAISATSCSTRHNGSTAWRISWSGCRK
jgi:hypothetical protein